MQDTNRTPGILNAYLLNKVTVYLALQWEELAPLNCKEKAVSPVQRMSAFYVWKCLLTVVWCVGASVCLNSCCDFWLHGYIYGRDLNIGSAEGQVTVACLCIP